MIKAGLPAYELIWPKLPNRLKEAMERYSTSGRVTTHEKKLGTFVRKQLTSILLYSAISIALGLLSILLLRPTIDSLFESWGIAQLWGRLLGMMVTLVAMAPFLWALAVKNVSRDRIRKMLHTYNHSQVAVIPLLALRYFIALFMVGWIISRYMHLAAGLVVVAAIVVVAVVLLSRRATNFYNRIEDHFVTNFYGRQAQNSFKIPESLEKNFVMERMTVTPYSPLSGKRLMDSNMRQEYGVNLVSIERAGKVYDLPDKEMLIMPADRLTLLGNEEQLSRVRAAVEVEPDMLIHDHSDNEINTYRLAVGANSHFVGMSIKDSHLMDNFKAMVIAIERGKDYMVNPPANTVFNLGDFVWIVSPLELKVNDLSAPVTDAMAHI